MRRTLATREVGVKVMMGRRPPGATAVGTYGSSYWIGSFFALWLFGTVIHWTPHAWLSLVIAIALIAIEVLLVLTPALVITPSEIILRGRRLRPAISWTEVTEILLPGFGGRWMRVRLADQTVFRLTGVGIEKAAGLHLLHTGARMAQPPTG
jgi:hypothetical protein